MADGEDGVEDTCCDIADAVDVRDRSTAAVFKKDKYILKKLRKIW